ncbi:hypothetical protein LINPERHAP2_LOCUS22884 [Linum perenne]
MINHNSTRDMIKTWNPNIGKKKKCHYVWWRRKSGAICVLNAGFQLKCCWRFLPEMRRHLDWEKKCRVSLVVGRSVFLDSEEGVYCRAEVDARRLELRSGHFFVLLSS